MLKNTQNCNSKVSIGFIDGIVTIEARPQAHTGWVEHWMALKTYTLNDRICAHSRNAAHATELPPNSRILFCNGQVGAQLDGSVPQSASEQLYVIFERIGTILSAASMSLDDIVRLTVYVTDKSIFDEFFRVREEILGDHNPPAVLLIVGDFPRAGVLVEVEAIAAKAD